MANLVQKLRKARECMVEAGGFEFTVRRPTDLEMLDMRGNGSSARLLPFIVGWNKVTEADVIPGGDPHPLPFDAEVCAEWLADRADLFGRLVEKLLELYEQHAQQRSAAEKN